MVAPNPGEQNQERLLSEAIARRRATQQAFFEAHEQAFHYFGGVFRLLSSTLSNHAA